MRIRTHRDALCVLRSVCRKIQKLQATVSSAVSRTDEIRVIELVELQRTVRSLAMVVDQSVERLQKCLAPERDGQIEEVNRDDGPKSSTAPVSATQRAR